MPEIKSTLELAMERTKHLRLSRQEREAQQAEQFKARLKGILYKFCAGMISSTEAESQLLELKNDFSSLADQVPTILRSILPLDEKGLEFSGLAGKVFDLNTKGVPGIINGYQKAVEEKKNIITARYLDNILAELQISGTALEVNLDCLDHWQTARTDLEKEFSNRLFTDS